MLRATAATIVVTIVVTIFGTIFGTIGARDLRVFWHPCSQMRDYHDFPPLEVVGARGCRLTPAPTGAAILDAISSWWCKSLGHGHPRAARGAASRSSTRFEHVIVANTTNAPLVRLCERLLAAANGAPASAWGPDAPPGRAPVTSARCSWPTTDRPPSRSRSRWRCRRRRSAGSRRARASRRWRNGYHGETLATLSVGDCGLYAAPYRALTVPGRRSSTACPTAAGPTTRAGWTPRAEWPAIEARAGAARARAGGDRLRAGAAGGGRDAALQPRSAAPAARWADAHGVYLIADEIAAGHGALRADAGQPPGGPARGARGAARLRDAVEGADRRLPAAVGGADHRRDRGAVRRRLRRGPRVPALEHVHRQRARRGGGATPRWTSTPTSGILERVAANGPRAARARWRRWPRAGPYLRGVRGCGMMAAVDIRAPRRRAAGPAPPHRLPRLPRGGAPRRAAAPARRHAVPVPAADRRRRRRSTRWRRSWPTACDAVRRAHVARRPKAEVSARTRRPVPPRQPASNSTRAAPRRNASGAARALVRVVRRRHRRAPCLAGASAARGGRDSAVALGAAGRRGGSRAAAGASPAAGCLALGVALGALARARRAAPSPRPPCAVAIDAQEPVAVVARVAARARVGGARARGWSSRVETRRRRSAARGRLSLTVVVGLARLRARRARALLGAPARGARHCATPACPIRRSRCAAPAIDLLAGVGDRRRRPARAAAPTRRRRASRARLAFRARRAMRAAIDRARAGRAAAAFLQDRRARRSARRRRRGRGRLSRGGRDARALGVGPAPGGGGGGLPGRRARRWDGCPRAGALRRSARGRRRRRAAGGRRSSCCSPARRSRPSARRSCSPSRMGARCW